MAKMNDTQTTPVTNDTIVSDNDTIVKNTPTKQDTDALSIVLNRLDKLEEENKALKEEIGGANVFKKAKERYEGPKAYSYKLWGGVPVLSYKSFKQDPTKDLLYKNQFGTMQSNHHLKLSLADDTEVDVEVTDFNRDYVQSEKQTCKVISDGVSVTGYTFDVQPRGEFTVLPSIIN